MPKVAKTVRLVLAAAAIGGGCRHAQVPQQTGVPKANTPMQPEVTTLERVEAREEGGTVIGHLKTRGKMITIRTGPDGPQYTVKSDDGRVLAVNLDQDQLSARFPDLNAILEDGLAGDDARLYPPARTIDTPVDVGVLSPSTVKVIL